MGQHLVRRVRQDQRQSALRSGRRQHALDHPHRRGCCVRHAQRRRPDRQMGQRRTALGHDAVRRLERQQLPAVRRRVADRRCDRRLEPVCVPVHQLPGLSEGRRLVGRVLRDLQHVPGRQDLHGRRPLRLRPHEHARRQRRDPGVRAALLELRWRAAGRPGRCFSDRTGRPELHPGLRQQLPAARPVALHTELHDRHGDDQRDADRHPGRGVHADGLGAPAGHDAQARLAVGPPDVPPRLSLPRWGRVADRLARGERGLEWPGCGALVRDPEPELGRAGPRPARDLCARHHAVAVDEHGRHRRRRQHGLRLQHLEQHELPVTRGRDPRRR